MICGLGKRLPPVARGQSRDGNTGEVPERAGRPHAPAVMPVESCAAGKIGGGKTQPAVSARARGRLLGRVGGRRSASVDPRPSLGVGSGLGVAWDCPGSGLAWEWPGSAPVDPRPSVQVGSGLEVAWEWPGSAPVDPRPSVQVGSRPVSSSAPARMRTWPHSALQFGQIGKLAESAALGRTCVEAAVLILLGRGERRGGRPALRRAAAIRGTPRRRRQSMLVPDNSQGRYW